MSFVELFLLGVPAVLLTGISKGGFGGALGIIITAIILSLLFILGVWIGDLITGSRDRKTV